MGQELAKYSVVLTTYATMALEAPARSNGNKRVYPNLHGRLAVTHAQNLIIHQKKGHQSATHVMLVLECTGDKSRKSGPLFEVDWHRVVLDEAQTIKNAHTLASHASRCLKVAGTLCGCMSNLS